MTSWVSSRVQCPSMKVCELGLDPGKDFHCLFKCLQVETVGSDQGDLVGDYGLERKINLLGQVPDQKDRSSFRHHFHGLVEGCSYSNCIDDQVRPVS